MDFFNFVNLANLARIADLANLTGDVVIEWTLLILLMICAFTLAISRHLSGAITAFVLYSMILSASLGFLGADSLAMAAAAAGAGIIGVMLLLTLRRLQQHDRRNKN